jgi:ubiquinone/menaquinone biosynthesis C-methylase UbiE
MNIKQPEKRLKKFWGQVDRKHISHIAEFVNGSVVLDMGCGYGTTTATIGPMQKCRIIGIDYDAATVELAKKRFPSSEFITANAESLPFADGMFDTVILRDALHHFYGEADFIKVKSEILRVSKKDATFIFFDPNVNAVLRAARVLSRHIDEECNYETALKIMGELNCKVVHTSFNTLYSLPLSGGYVGLNFVPNSKLIWSFLLGTEKFLEKAVNALRIGRWFAWRYIIVGKRAT